MSAALLAALLAVVLSGAEAAEYAGILRDFRAAAPEPEPPPGLKADPASERYRRARAAYLAALEAWRRSEDARRMVLIAACDAFLERHPASAHGGAVRYVRGVVRFRMQRWKAARTDLEAFLAGAPARGADTAAARAALVECCRALGDFKAALRWGGPTPDRLEEAGEVERAIAAAVARGDRDRASRWRLIGEPFPGAAGISSKAGVVLVEAGRTLPPESRAGLLRVFGKGKIAFASGSAPFPAIYLLDEERIVRAVDPRPDTLVHRIRRLLDGP